MFTRFKAQSEEIALKKGENCINIYYGYKISSQFFKLLAPLHSTDVKVTFLGPVGLVYEHMLTDVVGLGFEGGYGVTTVSYYTNGFDAKGNLVRHPGEIKVTNVRAMMRSNFHFPVVRNVDVYGLVSLGYRVNTYEHSSKDPALLNITVPGIIPFGLKPGFGCRYFFESAIGAHIEVAFGAPAVCGGLSARF